MTTQSSPLRGLLLMILAVVVISPDSLVIRLVSADRFVVMFWRGVFLAAAFMLVVVASERNRVWTRFKMLGRAGILAGLLLGATNVAFVLAVTNTDVANVLVISSMAPLFAAIIGFVLVSEHLPRSTIAAVVFSAGGVVVIFADSLAVGNPGGDALALVAALTLAGSLVAMRASTSDDLPAALAIGAAAAAMVALPFAAPWELELTDLALVAGFFGVLLPAAFLLIAAATVYLPAAEIGMLLLLEVILGPLWVWIGVGERPTTRVIAAGLFILVVVAAHAATRREQEVS